MVTYSLHNECSKGFSLLRLSFQEFLPCLEGEKQHLEVPFIINHDQSCISLAFLLTMG